MTGRIRSSAEGRLSFHHDPNFMVRRTMPFAWLRGRGQAKADAEYIRFLRHIGSICRQLSDFSILTGPTLAGLINS
jgi:hypothetical protein